MVAAVNVLVQNMIKPDSGHVDANVEAKALQMFKDNYSADLTPQERFEFKTYLSDHPGKAAFFVALEDDEKSVFVAKYSKYSI